MDADINKPIENPQLSKLLNELKSIDKSNDDLRYEKMNEIAKEFTLNAKLLSVIEINDEDIEEAPDGKVIFKKGAKFSVMPFLSSDNKRFLGAFTDWNELRKGEMYKDANVKTLVLSFDDYYGMINNSDTGIVINPFSDNIVFSPESIDYMKQRKDINQKGYTEIVNKKDTEVMIGEPDNCPHQIIEVINNYAKNIKEINAIWLKSMIRNNEKSFLVIIDYKGNIRDINADIAKAAVPFLPPNEFIDIVSYNDKFGRSVATGKPIYKKKQGLFSLFK